MATTLYLSPLTLLVQYFTNLGVIASGATITTYVAGSVSTLQTTYTDSTGLVANANPLTLNSSGRAAGQSGALVAFWVPSGTSLNVVFTDTLGETWSINNLPAINDPAAAGSISTQLASPSSSNASGIGPVAGVDLVANAIKSYDIFADVRAANEPQLSSGQTLSIQVQGGSSINDGLGGDFYWSATSTATDNGTTVLKPQALSSSAAGRWLRLFTPPLGALATITGATTTDLGSLGTNFIQVTGTSVSITSFGSSASTARPLFFVNFTGGQTIVYNSTSMITPGDVNIIALPGDTMLLEYLGSGYWQILAAWRGTGLGLGTSQLVKNADQAVTSSTALTADVNLTAPLQAGGTYLVSLRLNFLGTTSTTQGYKVQLNYSGTLLYASAGAGLVTANGTAAAATVAVNSTLAESAIATSTADVCNLDFVVNVSTAGQLTVQFAQNSSSANATTLKFGSTMTVTRTQ